LLYLYFEILAAGTAALYLSKGGLEFKVGEIAIILDTTEAMVKYYLHAGSRR